MTTPASPINLSNYKRVRKRYKLQKEIHKHYTKARPKYAVDDIITYKGEDGTYTAKIKRLAAKETVLEWYNVFASRGYVIKSFSRNKIVMANKYNHEDIAIITSKQALDRSDFEETR